MTEFATLWQKMMSQISNRRINSYVWTEVYNMGLRPPRYPVPALPLRAFIWPDAVDFFSGSGYVGSILKEEHHD